MLMEKNFMEKLKDFGLNIYESKIWIALLSRGISTAGELSDIANVPRSRSYDVLESLEKKGFIIMKIGKPIKYIAVKPHEVLERVKKKIRHDMVEKTSLIEEINGSEVLKELNLLYTNGVQMVEPSDMTASVKGRDNIYNHFELMLSSATDNVCLMTTETALIKKSKELNRIFNDLYERNVDIKILAPITDKNNHIIEDLSKYAKIKNISESKIKNSRFMIVDNKELMFMLLDDGEVHPSYDVGVWVNTPFFSESLKNMFDVIFDSVDEIIVNN